MKRLSTGISTLDRQLGGGIPSGSTLVLSATPASQSELFLYELIRARPTLYLTTLRSEDAVRDSINRAAIPPNDPKIAEIDGDAPLDQAIQLISTLPEESTLVIDPLDPLEATDPARYRRFLNQLGTHLQNTDSVAVLHALSGRHTEATRDVTEYMSDIIFDLRTEIRGSEIVNKLAVPKFRGASALEETIKLKLTESVQIDTSRDIA
ncbi:RAD55 family ATPase [Halalkalirubrum salinum]|uniref:RAD55 family ATPase n=1 Tax=Halalkalirubrum salinum TaxID=2563889 RepID=UPI0010FBB2A9|nr:RAD55 family ATPase [Halalkalirubrum salinum]